MTTLTLDDYTSAKMDALMATDRFASREEMVLQGLTLLEELADEVEVWPPEVIAAIDAGIASAEAGDLIPIEVVAEEMRRRFGTQTVAAAAE